LFVSAATRFVGDAEAVVLALIEQLIIKYINTVKHMQQRMIYLFFIVRHTSINKK